MHLTLARTNAAAGGRDAAAASAAASAAARAGAAWPPPVRTRRTRRPPSVAAYSVASSMKAVERVPQTSHTRAPPTRDRSNDRQAAHCRAAAAAMWL